MTQRDTIPRLLLAAPASGSGKTTVTCALLWAARRRGLSPCAFKCGPDYIDPMFHRAVLGTPSRNLDLFFCGEEQARARLLAAQGSGLAVLEGVMGFYDGIGMTDRASSWHVAEAVEAPVLLVVRPQGTALTLAAQLRGLAAFRSPSRIAGVLLNGCSEALARRLGPALEREAGLPVLGFLPHMPECALPSRHLGLFTPGEIAGLRDKLERLADQLEQTAALDRIFALARSAPPLEGEAPAPVREDPAGPAVAVARDEAFCFCYEDNLDELRRAGTRPVFFSPLRDGAPPPEACGLYLVGGYPELHAQALSENASMRRAVQAAFRRNMPILAECGGFLYLQETLEDPEGRSWPMAGVLEGAGRRTPRLQRFGYAALTARRDSLYLRRGERIAAHEFHRWDCPEGDYFRAERPAGGAGWDCTVQRGALLAGFPHLYFPSNPEFAPRFAAACRRYREEVFA